MDTKLYNTLSRKKEVFKPLKDGMVGIYNCGPTVYDTPHIGNYRTFVMDDLLRRVFEYNDYNVTQVMNITDVDDKTIRRSKEEGVSRQALAEKYEKLFLEGLDSLHILRPHQLLRATDNIQAMIELIKVLIEKSVAYKGEDGVYLSIKKVPNYGTLAGLSALKARAESQLAKGTSFEHSRIRNDEYDKENAHDFALWKFKSPEDGDNVWKADFGDGRPGWHIECSAMAMKSLGETVDIHTGGTDLIFPHHTNEIAQSESATGKPFAHYWLHGAFMNVSDEKMAKSKGNFLKLEDLKDQQVSPLAYRYWLLTAHYRSPVNFTFEAVKAAQNALIRLLETVRAYPEGDSIIPAYQERFKEAVNDDLNLPQAVALAWELLKDSSHPDANKRATLLDFDKVFCLDIASLPRTEEEAIPPEVQALAEAREEARKEKDWKKADALRAEIEARGFELKDTTGGFSIHSK